MEKFECEKCAIRNKCTVRGNIKKLDEMIAKIMAEEITEYVRENVLKSNKNTES